MITQFNYNVIRVIKTLQREFILCYLSLNNCQLSIKSDRSELAPSGCNMVELSNLDQMYEACKVFLSTVKVKRDPLLVRFLGLINFAINWRL